MVGSIFKIILFLISLYRESDKAKSKQKESVANEVINAFASTNKKDKIRRINAAVQSIGRL